MSEERTAEVVARELVMSAVSFAVASAGACKPSAALDATAADSMSRFGHCARLGVSHLLACFPLQQDRL